MVLVMSLAALTDAACEIAEPNARPDPAIYRDSLAALASGVAIAACWDGVTPKGLLVSSLTGLSTEPPRVLFCVRKAASAHDAFIHADVCSLNILNEADAAEAGRFSSGELAHQRFQEDRWNLRAPSPALKGALVTLTGDVRCRIDAATHTIIILDVTEARRDDGRPLVYFDRALMSLA